MTYNFKKGFSAIMIISAVALTSTAASAERLVAVGFLSNNYQTCTGNCEKENIDTSKDAKEPGSPQWCERNCINRGKAAEYQFIQGVKSTRTEKSES
jgi:hypothetical protein